MALLLKNCRFLVTQDANRRILEDIDVKISKGRIADIGKNLKGEPSETIDCSRSVVMPGLINTHTHIAMARLRGAADDILLEEFLEKTFEIDSHQSKKDVEDGALLGCLESIKFGTTCFADLYYWEDAIAKSACSLGIRANLSWACLDKEITTQKGDPIDNCAKFIRDWKGGNELITPSVGLQGVYACSESTCARAKELAEKEDTIIHSHLSETRREVYECGEKTGLRPVELFEKRKLLSDRLLAAHCCWLTKPEMDKLAKGGVHVSHNPTSNLKLSSGGLAPIPELLERGANVSLGTDGAASNNNLDLFKEMKLVALLHANAKWDARLIPAQKALDLATRQGAKALGIDAGELSIGKLADIIILPLENAHLLPCTKDNLISNIVYSAEGNDVKTSIINGEIIMQDCVVSGEDKIIDKFI